MTTFKKNVKLDAKLVHASMHGLFVPCAIQLGFTAQEASGRAEWLKRQDEEYVTKVANEVVIMECEEVIKECATV